MKIFYTISIFWFSCLLWPSLVLGQSPAAKNSKIYSQNSQSKKFNFSTDFSMGAIGFKESQDESQLVLFSARPKVSYSLTKDFGVRGDAQLNLTTGRSQTRFQNPNFNFVNILEMVAYYEPASFFKFSAGSINQNHFNNRMLIADRGFPGLVLKSGYENKKIRITPKAQYAIPTSTSFESDRTEAEALPSMTSYGVEADWKPFSWFNLQLNINQFQFNDLPSVVAFQSSRLGNSVIGTDPSESQFRYQFEGLSQSYAMKLKYSDLLSQEFNFAMADNSQAPSDRRRSQWASTNVSLDFGSFTVTPKFALFFAESDSVPSLYSDFSLGRNNRDGQYYGLEVNLKDIGVSIKANFVDARLIETRPLQADMQIFDIALEFNNVVL